mmetsp:Transcript_22772/g.61707  ORF Transcript_22772/g.61707 Transcript_22772/m.61707 type:complete len:214 (-) Transcript_22772:340-981(-)
MKAVSAVVTRSCRRARRMRSFWKGLRRLSHSPGSSSTSGRSYSSHSLHASVASSRSSVMFLYTSISLSAHALAHCLAVRNSCTLAVHGGGFMDERPEMRYSASASLSSPVLDMTLSSSCVARMSLWRSSSPRRVASKTQKVMLSTRKSMRASSCAGSSATMAFFFSAASLSSTRLSLGGAMLDMTASSFHTSLPRRPVMARSTMALKDERLKW